MRTVARLWLILNDNSDKARIFYFQGNIKFSDWKAVCGAFFNFFTEILGNSLKFSKGLNECLCIKTCSCYIIVHLE